MARLIKIDKKLYAVGLNWHMFSDKKQLPQKNDEYADVYCVNNGVKQFGLAFTKRDERFLGISPLVCAINLPKTYLGVFNLIDTEGKEFYYLLAVRQGKILSDTVLETSEEILTELRTIKDITGELTEIIFDTTEKSLEFFNGNLSKKKFFASQHIRPLYKSKKYAAKRKKIAFAVLAGFGLCYALINYLDARNLAELRASSLFSKQRLESKINDIYANKHRYFKMLWKETAYPMDVFTNCQPGLFSLPIAINGWMLEKAVCSQNSLTSYWEHKNQASFLQIPFDGELIKPKEARANHKLPEITLVQKEVEYTSLLSQEESSKLLYQLTQDMGANLNLSFGKSEVKEFKDLKISIVSPWKQGKFEWQSVPSSLLLNSSLFQILNTVPSLSIKEIEYNKGKWSVTGVFYVKS